MFMFHWPVIKKEMEGVDSIVLYCQSRAHKFSKNLDAASEF
jgi:hypothetical protein